MILNYLNWHTVLTRVLKKEGGRIGQNDYDLRRTQPDFADVEDEGRAQPRNMRSL